MGGRMEHRAKLMLWATHTCPSTGDSTCGGGGVPSCALCSLLGGGTCQNEPWCPAGTELGQGCAPRGVAVSSSAPLSGPCTHLWCSGQNKFLLAFPTWSSGDRPLRATSPSGTLRHPVGAPSEHPRGCLQEKPPHSPRGGGCLFGTPSPADHRLRSEQHRRYPARRPAVPPIFPPSLALPAAGASASPGAPGVCPAPPFCRASFPPGTAAAHIFGVMSSRSLCFPFRTAWRGPRCPATSRF